MLPENWRNRGYVKVNKQTEDEAASLLVVEQVDPSLSKREGISGSLLFFGGSGPTLDKFVIVNGFALRFFVG